MKNIIWKKPDGFYAVTFLTDACLDTSKAHADDLRKRGDVPQSWEIHAIDQADVSKFKESPPSPALQTARLKQSITPIRVAEHVLGIDEGWLKKTHDAIKAMGKK